MTKKEKSTYSLVLSIIQDASDNGEIDSLHRHMKAWRSPYRDLLNTKQAADYLRISKSTMQKYSADKLIPNIRVNGGKVWFTKRDLDRFMIPPKVGRPSATM